MNSIFSLFCVVLATVLLAQLSIAAPNNKGLPEVADSVYGADSNDYLNKLQGELMNALDIIQNYQESANVAPLKLAEKRRNKFEFIRFGRRRR